MKQFALSLSVAAVVAVVAQAGPPVRGIVPQGRGATVVPLTNPATAPVSSAIENIYDPFHDTRKEAYRIRTLGRAYQEVPPYALGYNPYIHWVNYGPVYPVPGPFPSLRPAVNSPLPRLRR